MADRGINTKIIAIVLVCGAVFGLGTFLLIDFVAGPQNPAAPPETIGLIEATETSEEVPTQASTQTPEVHAIQTPLPANTEVEEAPVVVVLPTDRIIPEPGSLLHVVQSDENLFRIALRYSVQIEDILVANGLTGVDTIREGQVLIIPAMETRAFATAPIANAPVAGTATPSITPSPTNTPTPTPPTTVNGIPIDSFIVMSPEVIANARQIFARGQEQGLNARSFSKVGDSTIENPHFLARFDEGTYELGDYAHLQTVVDYFAGSFARQGTAVRRGFHSWTVTDPMWADKELCLPNETPVACEIRLNKPSILFIRLGSNDAGVPGSFDFNVRQVVEYAIEKGVIPVIGTKADRFEGGVNINNDILRQIAVDYQLPLWDFDLISATIPNRGLYPNDVHLTIFFPHDYTQPLAFQTGHGVHNLTALLMLEAILQDVIEAG